MGDSVLQIEAGQLEVLHDVARIKVPRIGGRLRLRHERRLDGGHLVPVERREERHRLHFARVRPGERIHGQELLDGANGLIGERLLALRVLDVYGFEKG